jgi:hypothetical protein
MGDKPPVRAVGMGGRQVRSEVTIGNIYDHHAVVYEYGDGVRLYSFCRRQAGCANETSDLFFGTTGQANILKHTIDGENAWRYQGPKCNMYDAEHEALFASIRDASPINNGLYMAHSTMLAILGRMVTYSGKEITWKQAINSTEDLSPTSYAWDADPPAPPDADGKYPLAVPGVTPFV